MKMSTKALIVTDTDVDVIPLVTILRKMKYTSVTIMGNYQEALQELKKGFYYNFIFLEMANGPEAAETLVEMKLGSMIIGIISDPHDDPDLDRAFDEYLHKGAEIVLAKPLREDFIREVLVGDTSLAAESMSQPSTLTVEQVHFSQLDQISKRVLILSAEKPEEQLVELFNKYNFDIMATNDYEGVLAKLRQTEHYDIIFLDIDNGLEVAKSLHEMESKALIIGVVSDEEELYTVGDQLVANGVNVLFAKPLNVDGLEMSLASNGLLPDPLVPTAFEEIHFKIRKILDLQDQLPEPKGADLDVPKINPVLKISKPSCSSSVHPVAMKTPSAMRPKTSESDQVVNTLKGKEIANMDIGSVSDIQVLESEKVAGNWAKDILAEALSGISIKDTLDIPGCSNLSDSPRTVIPDPSRCDQLGETAKNVLILSAEKPELFIQILEKQNFDTMTTSDCEGAIAKLRQGEHYDIMYLDMDNGPEVAKSLREMEAEALIIGIVSNEEELDTVGEELIANGVNEVLAKPLSVDGIESILASNSLLHNPTVPTAHENVFAMFRQMLELSDQLQRLKSPAQDFTTLLP